MPLLETGTRQRVEANTPVFWSVGAGDARLERWTTDDFVRDESDPQAEPRRTTETGYRLNSAEAFWGGDPVFVFPLTK